MSVSFAHHKNSNAGQSRTQALMKVAACRLSLTLAFLHNAVLQTQAALLVSSVVGGKATCSIRQAVECVHQQTMQSRHLYCGIGQDSLHLMTCTALY